MKVLKRWILILILNMTQFSHGQIIDQDRFLFELEKIDLFLGLYEEIEMKDLPDESRFKIPDRSFSSMMDISWDNNKKVMRIKPKKAGSTLLTFVDTKDGKIIKQIRFFINVNDLDRVAKEIKSLLGDIEGIEIKVLNNKVIVDGQIILPSDMNRIVSVIQQYEKQAVSLVRLSPLAMTKIANLIERDINNPEISVRVINSFFVLEGVARDLDERDEALRIAQAYVPAKIAEFAAGNKPSGTGIIRRDQVPDGEYVLTQVINHLRIQPDPPSSPPKVVQVVVHFVELQKSYQRGFSFKWIPTIGDGTEYRYSRDTAGGSETVGSITAIISNLLPKLDWAREHGHARVLKSVSMIVEDGKQGIFEAKNQVPVIVSTINGIGAGPPREVGIDLKVTPTVTGSRSDIIALQVEFESGEILENGGDAGPLTSKNKINTKVTVRSGQSAALGGLVSSRSGTDYNKLNDQASNGGDPLFKLLASKAFNRGQSQFVMFITPYIKSSASVGSEKIKKKFRIDR